MPLQAFVDEEAYLIASLAVLPFSNSPHSLAYLVG